MSSADDNEIRELIERWAAAVRANDLATALLRCGTEEDLTNDPDNRLRLTVGLRNEGGRWVVSHEHHSFPARE
jgi:ketosteroid isomerase-like protein